MSTKMESNGFKQYLRPFFTVLYCVMSTTEALHSKHSATYVSENWRVNVRNYLGAPVND